MDIVAVSEKLIIPVFIPLIVTYVTVSIAKKQIINAGVTHFRQEWINSLRSEISHFISLSEVIAVNPQNAGKMYQALCEANYKIELFLNPLEEDHIKIAEVITRIRLLIFSEDILIHIDNSAFDDEIEELLKVSKSVLKREWNVVKSGK